MIRAVARPLETPSSRSSPGLRGPGAPPHPQPPTQQLPAGPGSQPSSRAPRNAESPARTRRPHRRAWQGPRGPQRAPLKPRRRRGPPEEVASGSQPSRATLSSLGRARTRPQLVATTWVIHCTCLARRAGRSAGRAAARDSARAALPEHPQATCRPALAGLPGPGNAPHCAPAAALGPISRLGPARRAPAVPLPGARAADCGRHR